MVKAQIAAIMETFLEIRNIKNCKSLHVVPTVREASHRRPLACSQHESSFGIESAAMPESARVVVDRAAKTDSAAGLSNSKRHTRRYGRRYSAAMMAGKNRNCQQVSNKIRLVVFARLRITICVC
jgi:hypothetical protein